MGIVGLRKLGYYYNAIALGIIILGVALLLIFNKAFS